MNSENRFTHKYFILNDTKLIYVALKSNRNLAIFKVLPTSLVQVVDLLDTDDKFVIK